MIMIGFKEGREERRTAPVRSRLEAVQTSIRKPWRAILGVIVVEEGRIRMCGHWD